jgi:hypothetical protein
VGAPEARAPAASRIPRAVRGGDFSPGTVKSSIFANVLEERAPEG